MKVGKGKADWKKVPFAEYPDPCTELRKLMADKGSHVFFFSIKYVLGVERTLLAVLVSCMIGGRQAAARAMLALGPL